MKQEFLLFFQRPGLLEMRSQPCALKNLLHQLQRCSPQAEYHCSVPHCPFGDYPEASTLSSPGSTS